jgi:hypothetical protein
MMEGSMRIYGRLIPLAFFVLSGATVPAGTNKLTGIPRATPSAIYAAEAAIVTITAPVAADPDSPPLSINLLRVNERGKPVRALGRLYDDGTHGDAVAGDSAFTGQFSFHEPNPIDIRLVVTIAYRGTLLRTQSPAFTLDVRRRSASVERQPILPDQQNAAWTYETLRGQVGVDAARTACAVCLDEPQATEESAAWLNLFAPSLVSVSE